MNETLRDLFLKISQEGNEKYIKTIMKETSLSFRTVREIAKIVYAGIDDVTFSLITKKSFYTFPNMVLSYKKGLREIIPSSFYEDEHFIMATGMDTLPNNFAEGDDTITSFKIPSGITKIGDKAFKNCTRLSDITLPDGLLSIGDKAFENCHEIVFFNMPNSVSYIGEGAFSDCTLLQDIILPHTTKEIKRKTFKNCKSLSFVAINNKSIEDKDISTKHIKIQDEAFQGCGLLEDVGFVASYIGNYAFDSCDNLKEIRISSSEIGKYAFAGCSSLSKAEFYEPLSKISKDAFLGCSALEEIDISGFSYERSIKGYEEITKTFRKGQDGKIYPKIIYGKELFEIISQIQYENKISSIM